MIKVSRVSLALCLSIILMSPGKAAPPISGENLEAEKEEQTEKDQRRRIVSLTPEDETLDEIEDMSTSIIIPTTGISASDNEDSEFPSVLEVVGYLAALPLLAISPFLLLGLAVILLPLLAGSSFLLIVMVLAGSVAIMLPVLLGMPTLFLPILLLAIFDGEQTEVLFERLPEGSGLDNKNTTLSINISDLISALSTVTISPEKDIDWNATTILTSSKASVDSVNFEAQDNVDPDVDENVNKIPHSAVPRLLSW